MLTRGELLREIKSARIRIDPYDQEFVNTNSIDLRLGTYYLAPPQNHSPNNRLINHLRSDHIHQMWRTPQVAERARAILYQDDLEHAGVNPDVPIIILPPRGF